MSQSPDATRTRIADNVSVIRQQIAEAAKRSGREAEDVELVGVTKYVSPELAGMVLEAGVRDLGESRPQELEKKHEALLDAEVRWHLIGPLQRNKARRVLPYTHLIQSVDRWKLVHALERLAEEIDKPCVHILLEVNVSGEPEKHGFAPESLPSVVEQLAALSRVRTLGLMAMAARDADEATLRRQFSELRMLRERVAGIAPDNAPMQTLSMGMTGDFQIAVEEGATMVRVGSGLFAGLDS